MKKFAVLFIFICAAIAVGSGTAAAYYPGEPLKQERLESGLPIQLRGIVQDIDWDNRELWLRKPDGGVTNFKANRRQLSLLEPGDSVILRIRRLDDGLDHVMNMEVIGPTGNYNGVGRKYREQHEHEGREQNRERD